MDTNDIYPTSTGFYVITPLVQTTNWEVSRTSVKDRLIQGVIFNLLKYILKKIDISLWPSIK